MRTAIAEAENKKLVRAGYVKEGTPSQPERGAHHEDRPGAAHRAGRPGSRTSWKRRARSWRWRCSEGRPSDADRRRSRARDPGTGSAPQRVCRFSTTSTCATATAWCVPQPAARAVMFCLMDVSASMDERKKDLAKRFFTLLYLFLTRKYEQVELVFIRHTDEAEEVDEDTFFHDHAQRRHGGAFGAGADAADLRRALSRAPSGISTRRRPPTAMRSAPTPARAPVSCASTCCRWRATSPTSRCPDDERRGATAACGSSTRSWSSAETATSPCGGCHSPSEIYPVFRELFSKEQRYERAASNAAVLPHGPEWDFELIERYDAAIAETAAEFAAGHLSEPDRDHQLRADARRLRRPAGCRSAIRTGPTARRSSATSSPIARAIRGSPTRSSSTPAPASPI